MNKKRDYLLMCAAEECNEIAKELIKCVRFGIDGFNPIDPDYPNRVKVFQEFVDLTAVLELLSMEGDMDFNDIAEEYGFDFENMMELKKKKVLYYFRDFVDKSDT